MAVYDLLWNSEHFWNWKMKRGNVSPPEPAYVPVKEKYDLNAIKNILREWYGRYACPACGKPYFFARSAWNCHPKASAYKLWCDFAHRSGPMGASSISDMIASGCYFNGNGGGPGSY